MTTRAAFLALALGLLPGLALAAKDSPGRAARADKKPAAKPASGCKEPAPKDADLSAGLKAYQSGDFKTAATSLGTWAAKPDADRDPAAARGMYALAYARRATSTPGAEDAVARAQPLLEARTQSQPTLEAWYYLQGLHQMRGDEQAQLAAISAALKSLDAGEICATRDGDDWFRVARLQEFAGNHAQASDAMTAAGAAYDALPEGAPSSPYRALVEQALGKAALTSNDLAEAERHDAMAAKLDPSIPGIHRELGLIYLRRGNLQAAADHWRSTWRIEQGGNDFMYAIPLINKILEYRKTGLEPLTGLSAFTVPSLEDNAKSEGKTFLELQQAKADAAKAGTPFPPEKEAQMKAAEYRCLQYLLEYTTRGENLSEFALQNGLLPVIHGRDLPSR